jgi:lipopolysaccharide/colanic/teichoic acid biosynthesis glycosyltransferase
MIVSEIDTHPPIPGTAPATPDVVAVTNDTGSGPLKRAMDLTLGTLLVLMCAPIILGAMGLVRLTSRGPAIYRQVRLGRGNRQYTIYKIRSMHHNCESETGARWATKKDSRVTPVGRFLRASHIDELPQLWNVLVGEMSLVGPRPERPEIAVELEMAIPNYADRLQVRPGLTGLAQVQLPPDTSLADVKRKLACDLHYIEHAGFWLDIRILISTFTYVVGVPFHYAESLLRVPSVDAVEALRRRRNATRVLGI